MTSYLRYIGPALWAWAHWRWLWTHDATGQAEWAAWRLPIVYKPGWSPLKFLICVYWWDYLLGVFLGYGVCSVSRGAHLLGKKHWRMTGPPLWGVKPWRE